VTIAPGDFEIPDGVGVVGLSVIDGRTVIVGDDGVIRVYDSESQTPAAGVHARRVRGGGTSAPARTGDLLIHNQAL
jgi:hypothetical protein